MPAPLEKDEGDSYQTLFHRRWNHLQDPHVRTLAWVLDAPDLLDPAAPEWQGRVASLPAIDADTLHWLAELDRAPSALHAHLALHPFTRLGRYAESLLAYYLRERGALFAHGLQIRAGRGETIGEFDFLLDDGEGLVHWEFATKLYLLESNGHGRHADYFVGPNLADTLGAKVRKIMEQQLSLSAHPQARLQLPKPVSRAQALMKGWLFYQGQTPAHPAGISAAHCKGFWRPRQEARLLAASRFLILPRLEWLAPARAALGAPALLGLDKLGAALDQAFAATTTPVLIALLKEDGTHLLEFDRGFIVPDDWRQRAAARTADI